MSELISSVLLEGLNWKNMHHLPLMWTPNIFNPEKLIANLRHPIGEVLHTSHKQYPIELAEGIEHYLVEHRLRSKLVTVDIVSPDVFPSGAIPRLKQLFDRNFYYGHDKYFPQPFRLVTRRFVDGEFNLDAYLNEAVISNQIKQT